MESPNADSTQRSIRRFGIALWILVVLAIANLLVSVLTLFSPALLTKRITQTLPQEISSSESTSLTAYNSFHDWPLEKQIKTASVIAIGKWQKSDSTLKCVISEILKQSPSTTFYYKVGDEFRPGNQHIRGNETYGDGQILFFTGSPASFRYSMTFSGDRVSGAGDMPMTELRNLIRNPAQ